MNKNEFMTLPSRSGIEASSGAAWTPNVLNPLLNRLMASGLLKPDYSCAELLQHDLAIEMIASPHGLAAAQALRRAFPPLEPRSHIYRSTPLQLDTGANVGLRLALYQSDFDAFRAALESYDTAFSLAVGPHILETLFADAVLEASWVASLPIDIPFRLFSVKIARLLSTGEASADTPALLTHDRDREDSADYADFKWAKLRVEILSGKLDAAKRKVHAMAEASPEIGRSVQHLQLGSLEFLEGRNGEALAEFRLALELYRKEAGRRKVFFEGYDGLLFLPAAPRHCLPLIVNDSIEAMILELHRSKRDLASEFLEGTEVGAKLSEDDLLKLIRV